MEGKKRVLSKSIGRTLKEKRLERGLTQQDIAKDTGLKTSNISRIEKGNQNLSLDMLDRFCYSLEVEPRFVMEDILPYGENTEYELRIFDEVLLSFSMKRDINDSLVEIKSVVEDRRHLFPVSLDISNEGLKLWLKRRSIPENRAHITEILESIGIKKGDFKGLADYCFCLSLDDSYWVCPAGSNLKFSKVNLFENKFSSQMGLISFVGMSQTIKERRISSPEFTTGGMLRKGWRRPADKEGIYLYKGGSEEVTGYEGNEPYSEYYAYQIAKAMGLNAVEYGLERWKGVLSSYCKLFTSKDISFVPCSDFPNIYEIEDALEYYKSLGKEYHDSLCDMLVFDVLICNRDRHFGNFGLLRNNKTGEFVGPAPIFDNGLSLFCFGSKADYEDLKAYSKKQSNPYERTSEEILSLVMSKGQKDMLKKLKDFKFSEHQFYNLPSWRLKAIEEYLKGTAKEIISTY